MARSPGNTWSSLTLVSALRASCSLLPFARRTSAISGLACTLVTLWATHPALAQDNLTQPGPAAPPPKASTSPKKSPQTTPAKPASDVADEIVVTAQHRRENVQTTPIAVSVYNGQALRTAGITDLEGLTAVAPDTSFTETEGKPIITIRGISSRDTTEVGDPAITVDTDGFYLNRPYALTATLYDLDRIEVLRGPQGTLNGRNAVGGALNIITAKPTDQLGGFADFAYGNYNDIEGQGAINVPLSPQVQVRASFFSDNHDGYRDVAPNGRADDADDKTGRLQIAFEPTDRLHGLITFEDTHEGGEGDAMQNIPYVYTPTGALVHALPAGINSQNFPAYTRPYLDLDEWQLRGNLVYDFDPVEVTLLGGYDDTHWHHNVDQTNPYSEPNVSGFDENQFPKTANAELRFTSRNNSPFQWQAGGFFFQENSHLTSADAAPTAAGEDYYFGFKYKTLARSEAGYAQASYQLTRQIKVTGGVRYTHDEKSENGYYGDLTTNTVYAYQSGSTSSSKPTFHAEVEDKLTSTNFVYAKFDTGYKAGGFNLGGSSYMPETIQSWEIGSKNRFLDRRLQLNVAGYYSDYTNQQVANYAYLPNGEPVELTQNAGASTIYGLETDLLYDFREGTRFNLNVDYLHARYTNFVAAADPSDPSQSGNVQLAGNRPPQSPTWSLAAGLEHEWDIYNSTLTARIQTKVQSESNFSFYNYQDTLQRSYTMSDFFLTFRPVRSRWTITGYVRNLENSVVFADAEESAYANSYAYEYYPPRTYGVRVQYKW